MQLLAVAATSALAAVFLAAGLGKALAHRRFRETLLLTGLVAPRQVPLVRVLLPALEVLVGLLLVSGVLRPLGSVLAVGLLAVFTVRTWPAARSGAALPCSCFGTTGESIDAGLPARNLALIAYAVVGWLAGPAAPGRLLAAFVAGPAPRLVAIWIVAGCLLAAPFVLAHLVSLWRAAPRLADLPALAGAAHGGHGP